MANDQGKFPLHTFIFHCWLRTLCTSLCKDFHLLGWWKHGLHDRQNLFVCLVEIFRLECISYGHLTEEVIKTFGQTGEFQENIFFYFRTASNLPPKPGPPGNQHPQDPGTAVGKIFSHDTTAAEFMIWWCVQTVGLVHVEICNFVSVFL